MKADPSFTFFFILFCFILFVSLITPVGPERDIIT